jgi:hypothetical protein
MKLVLNDFQKNYTVLFELHAKSQTNIVKNSIDSTTLMYTNVQGVSKGILQFKHAIKHVYSSH